ncbi:restriction alleviation protein [Pseudomonas phage AUS531phi]|nr:restriction alleviation protein [Pseudomonas phage AUS531phi]
MLPLPAAGAGATGDTAMSSTQHQLIEQCATRLRGIVEALDNIHDTSPHRWSTDLDDVHSSAESLLALIKDQAPTQAAQDLAMLVRMLASSLKRHAPESNLVARATNYLAAKGLAGTPLRDAPASVEQAGRDVEPAPCPFCGGEVDPTGWLRGDGTRGPECNDCGATARSMEAWQTRAAPTGQTPQAWLDVQAERRRQIEAEGWTPEHDDAHSHGEMARAAACYALAGSSAPNDGTAALLVSLAWPWDEQWWKPTSARRDLVKACALALAEIERLDRAGISQNPQPGATTASS